MNLEQAKKRAQTAANKTKFKQYITGSKDNCKIIPEPNYNGSSKLLETVKPEAKKTTTKAKKVSDKAKSDTSGDVLSSN